MLLAGVSSSVELARVIATPAMSCRGLVIYAVLLYCLVESWQLLGGGDPSEQVLTH